MVVFLISGREPDNIDLRLQAPTKTQEIKDLYCQEIPTSQKITSLLYVHWQCEQGTYKVGTSKAVKVSQTYTVGR